jgi:spore germination cell wall hydrolase CwlJ-like protein
MTLHPRDSLIKAALSHEQTVAMTIWAESRAEPVEGQIAVGNVIRNRVLRPKRFSNTFKDVCLARLQFSCWVPAGGEKNYQMLLARCERALSDPIHWPRQALWIAQGIVSNDLADNVAGADHYYAKWMEKPPSWAARMTFVTEIYTHRFYRETP